ncbi:hypothetical protein C8R45DRAFT_1205056 [Mycena sanguinolenta]|nr:hypothetical protein C8R45DRAFT_1205056 [Mycena sanguinolenta]
MTASQVPKMTHDADRLRRIVQSAKDIKRLVAPLCVDITPAHRSTPIPTVSLPPPPCIRTELLHLGLPAHLVQDRSQKYDRACEELRSAAQLSLQRACREFTTLSEHSSLTPLSHLSTRMIAAYTANYKRSLEVLQQRAIDAAAKLARNRGDGKKPSKAKPRKRTCSTPFNHEFTPFLEKYFEYNAYPSSADQAVMAKKSMMEPRQIDVWFQNHRARAKKEGRKIKRLHATDPVPSLCLKSMEEKMEPYLIPDGLRQSVDSEVSDPGSEDEDDDDDDLSFDEPDATLDPSSSDALNRPAPRHAFPVKFADRLKYASAILPTQQHFSFPAPKWARRAAVGVPRRAEASVEEMCMTFATLHVYDTRQVMSPPFQIPTTVVPPRAPLPALRAQNPNIPVVPRARVPSLINFGAPSVLESVCTNMVPADNDTVQWRIGSPIPAEAPPVEGPRSPKRKASGPPRRAPPRKRVALDHRGSERSPSIESSRTPSLESSRSSSSSPPSRTPSFGSSRSSSTSTSYSSGPNTPPSPPSALPASFEFTHDPAHPHARVYSLGAARVCEYLAAQETARGARCAGEYGYGYGQGQSQGRQQGVVLS